MSKEMRCMCGDSECRSCGDAQGTREPISAMDFRCPKCLAAEDTSCYYFSLGGNHVYLDTPHKERIALARNAHRNWAFAPDEVAAIDAEGRRNTRALKSPKEQL